MDNIFNKKKKDYTGIQSVFKQPEIQWTGSSSSPKEARSQAVNKSAQEAKQYTPVAQQLVNNSNPVGLPWGASQPSFSGAGRTTQRQQPQMSQEPQMSQVPQMSVEPNQPQPQPQAQPQPQVDPSQQWLEYMRGVAQRQTASGERDKENQMNYLKGVYGNVNQQLQNQLPQAQGMFDKFKTNTEASIADLLARGDIQKDQTEDYYGSAQRDAAQTLRETQGQTQRTFSNLGTLDSRGEGSFQEANANTMSDFNRYTQENLKAEAQQLSEIDMNVAQARRSAESTIYEQESKLQDLARQIQSQISMNNLNEAKGLVDAYNATQEHIYDIQDALAQTEYQFGLEKQKLTSSQNFSPEFMTTGQPTNQSEFEFFIKNKDAMNDFGNAGGPTESGLKVSGIVDQLLSMDTGAVTGMLRQQWTNGAANVAGLVKQLNSELQLEEAKRMKGQGTLSDGERAILANAVASFNLDENELPRVSDQRFREILQELQAGTGVQSLDSLLGA